MELEIVVYPHPTLRKVCDPVQSFDEELRAFVEAMFEAMERARGIGLAAPQVDVPRRIVVVRISRDQEPEVRRVLINPVVLSTHGLQISMAEGCLSFPGMSAEIVRPEGVTISYQALDGERVEERAEGLLARVYQHEIDHLDGVLFFDHLSFLKRELFKKKYNRLLKQGER
jgi:peptide deformylase